MKIKIERSGGFAGISSSCELDADMLPPSFEGTIQELLDHRRPPLTIGSNQLKVASDYFNYKITIRNGKKACVIECNELQMDSGMKSLVNYVQRNSEKNNKSH